MYKITVIFSIVVSLIIISCSKNDQGTEKKIESPDRYISSKDGLKMRENPDTSGKQIAIIPEGDKVLLLEESGNEISISNITGRWSKVKWNDKTGWVFGGFLSTVPVLKSDLLEGHFTKIAIDSSPEGGEGCKALKKVNDDSVYGSGGACDKEVLIIEDTTVAKNSRIYFKRQDNSGEDCSGTCPELDCKSTLVEIFECFIDGSEIMKIKENDTYTGLYKCTLISSKKMKKGDE